MNKLNQEEKVLYLFTFLIMMAVFAYFRMVFKETSHPSDGSIIGAFSDDLSMDTSTVRDEYFIQIQQMKAQLQLVNKRYEMASRINNAIAYVKYISFAVGTLLCLLGTIIVFKGVRETPIVSELSTTDNLKLKLSTSSPGAFVVFLGTIIICISIIYKNEIEVIDNGILLGQSATTTSKEINVTEGQMVLFNELPEPVKGAMFQLNQENFDIILDYTNNPK